MQNMWSKGSLQGPRRRDVRWWRLALTTGVFLMTPSMAADNYWQVGFGLTSSREQLDFLEEVIKKDALAYSVQEVSHTKIELLLF